MKVIHLLIIGMIVFVLGCSKDEYCVVKNDLFGTWVSVDDEDNYIIFKDNNTYSLKDASNIKYGFLALDTLAILGHNDRIVDVHYFEFQEENLFIEAFDNGEDIIYKRPE